MAETNASCQSGGDPRDSAAWVGREAWRQGYVAGRRGLVNDCNPFPGATAEALAWTSDGGRPNETRANGRG